MSGRWLHYLWLAYFSKPKGERLLFRLIRQHQVRSIVEIGVGDLSRAPRLIDFARQFVPNGELRYTGIDLFEAREDPESGVSLKDAHGRLKPLDAKIKLIPGDPFSALARNANGLAGTDLVMISHDSDEEAMQKAWFYLPRMLHANTLVLSEQMVGDEPDDMQTVYERLTEAEIRSLAGPKAEHIAKAA